MNSKNIAIVYDFDGTLTPQDSCTYSLFPALGLTADAFWGQVDNFGRSHQIDPHSTGLLMFKYLSEQRNIAFTQDFLASHGKAVKFCPGVEDWFGQINAVATDLGFNIHHYIISAGLGDLIRATKIAHHFEKIFACEYCFDDKGHALWPAHVVNATNKLQFLFRIYKGMFNLGHYTELYDYIPQEDRLIPFENIIFIGDGETDVPCLKVTNQRGGLAIAVYPDEYRKVQAENLMKYGRANHCCKADYRQSSLLFEIISNRLKQLA